MRHHQRSITWCSAEVTTKDFDVRSLQWLGELLGGSGTPHSGFNSTTTA
jgi:hypothetical protein